MSRSWLTRLGLVLLAFLACGTEARADDDGQVCGRAQSAEGDELVAVIDACTRITFQRTPDAKVRVYRARGVALLRNHDPAAAIADFDIVLQLAPTDKFGLKGRAEAHEALGHIALAISDYRRLESAYPDTRWRIKIAELGGPQELAATEPGDNLVRTPSKAAEGGSPIPLVRQPAANTPTPQSERQSATPSPPVVTAPVPDQNEALIKQLQAALRGLGYEVSVTGRISDQTRRAIDAFAPTVDLSAGRAPDAELLAAAQSEVSRRQHEAAAQQQELIRRAQSSLADLGYQIGTIDGVLGSRSRTALADWSAKRGAPPPRNVDLAVVEALEASVASRLQVVAKNDPPEAIPPAPQPPKVLDTLPAPTVEQPTPPQQPPFAVVPPATPNEATATVLTNQGCTPVADASLGKRVALVIGNSAYEHVQPLKNPRTDAEDMSKALCQIGFDVVAGYDLDRNAMDDKTIEFRRRAETADLAFVYYSGHGIQVEGRNYLVPIDAKFEDRQDVRRLVQLDQLTDDTSAAKKAILVVDACRNDPSQPTSVTRSIGLNTTRAPISTGPGLAQPNLRQGSRMLVAFATGYGKTAYDGDPRKRNSPYVEALLRHLKTPGVDVTRVFGMVQDDVAKETRNEQEPVYTASLGGDQIFLVAAPPTPITPAKPVGLALAELTPGELQAIQSVIKRMGYWPRSIDGQASVFMVNTLKTVQRLRGEEDTGLLTPDQMLALYRQYALQAAPLPPFNSSDVADLAADGDPEAQRQMGMAADPLFEEKSGTAKNSDKALKWYRRASAQGDRIATTRLGLLLATSGSPGDQAEAQKLLKQAANAHDPLAALRLAELLLDEPDVAAAKDPAVELLKIARADPDTDAIATAHLRLLGVPIAQ